MKETRDWWGGRSCAFCSILVTWAALFLLILFCFFLIVFHLHCLHLRARVCAFGFDLSNVVMS